MKTYFCVNKNTDRLTVTPAVHAMGACETAYPKFPQDGVRWVPCDTEDAVVLVREVGGGSIEGFCLEEREHA